MTDLDRHPRGPEELKAAAKALGLPRVTDLLALTRGNDPYLFGTGAERRDAQWFADLWRRFGYTTGVHLRRVHYQVFSTRGTTATGDTYQNTDKCWSDLLSAGKFARALGLVDPEAFVDRRNDPPRLHVTPREYTAMPSCGWYAESEYDDLDDWRLPSIPTWAMSARFPLGHLSVTGYDYDPDDQPVLVEVWIEKSTMDDVLLPVCRAANVNLLSGSGFQSITATIGLLRRAEAHGKPAHVIYISDFDPAGAAMPISVARQAQFWACQLGIKAELTIEPVALTLTQVQEYQLPRAPVKVDKNGVADPRGKRFEQVNGVGIVELDALEALHPGTLADLVWRAIRPYRDDRISDDLLDAHRRAQVLADRIWQQETAELRADRDRLEERVNAVADQYRGRLAALAGEMAEALRPYREELDQLRRDVRTVIADVDIIIEQLPVRPLAEVPDVDRDLLLYDSRRPWQRQLQAYRAAKGEAA